MPKMEHCVINIRFLIKLEKVQAQYFSTKILRDLKAFIITILGRVFACYGDSLLHA